MVNVHVRGSTFVITVDRSICEYLYKLLATRSGTTYKKCGKDLFVTTNDKCTFEEPCL